MPFSLMTRTFFKHLAKVSFSVFLAFNLSAQVAQAQSAKPLPQVLFTTNMGQFTVELEPEKAPKTVANFLAYVNSGFYTGTIFHRVINGFMVQGGGFTKDLMQKPTRAQIPIESNNGLKNSKYSIAMARTNDPNSATAQFFVNVKDNAMLDYPGRDGYGYTVFGRVIAGMDTIENIKFVETNVDMATRMSDVPVKPIVIESAKVIK
jgi:peptidyl-prolyl cis-trans isomerase A (cyclophilin A)